MKLLDQFRNKRKKKVDARSEPFTKKVIDLLSLYGLSNPIDARFCSLELFMATYNHYNAIKKSGKDATDDIVNKHGDILLAILVKYGIDNPEEQDALLCQYIDFMDEATVK